VSARLQVSYRFVKPLGRTLSADSYAFSKRHRQLEEFRPDVIHVTGPGDFGLLQCGWCARDTFGAMTWLTWSLLSAFFAAATAILAKLGIKGVDANVATAVRTSVVVVFTWLLTFLTREPTSLQTFSKRTWLFLVLSGLATGLSWLCYFHALQVGPASRVAPVDKLSVVLVIVFGALFLGERLSWARGAGGLLIVTGAIIIALE